MTDKYSKQIPKIVIVGPYPPPEHGTSLPFKEMVKYLQASSAWEIRTINTQSGDKAGKTLVSAAVAWPGLILLFRLLRELAGASCLIVYGSQRFCCTFGVVAPLIARARGQIPLYMYVQGGGFDEFLGSINGICRRYVLWGCRRYDAVYVQTSMLCSALIAKIPKVAQIPNWIRQDWLTSGEAAPEIPLNKNQIRRFMFLGEVREEKGVSVLVDAFRSLADNPSIELSIFGPIRPAYRAKFHQLLLTAPSTIRYCGELRNENVRQALWNHDALILPTFFPTEGYPGVILEAMSQRRLVITTRWRAIPEIAIDGETAVLCQPRAVQDLARALQWCVEHPIECASIAGRAGTRMEAYTSDSALSPLRDSLLIKLSHAGTSPLLSTDHSNV